MSISFDAISNDDGEHIMVSCTLRNGLRIEVSVTDGDWECFNFETPEQAELVASQLMKAAAAYRASFDSATNGERG